jgi:phospholipase/carboxylesterase
MAAASPDPRALWLELPAMSPSAPARLLVFLHGAGSRPEAFAPVAIAWQLKFPGATVAILQAPRPGAGGYGFDWYDSEGTPAERLARADDAARDVVSRVRALQQHCGLDAARTVLIGFSQGATVALQALRGEPELCGILVAYAARLASPIRPGERIDAAVHLVHGELDTVVPLVWGRRALDGLRAAGADVTLDIGTEDGHGIGQEGVIVGTTRVMRTVFRDRRATSRPSSRLLH